MKFHIIVSLALLALLSACSTMSKTDCLEMDWQQQGFEDGSEGVEVAQAESYSESCSRHDVQLDMDAYLEGHASGLRLFCKPDNGFEQGREGYRYTVGFCPADLERLFLGEYRVGLEFYSVYRSIDELETRRARSLDLIGQLNDSINSNRDRANGGNISVQEENQLRQSIDSLEGQIRIHEDEILRIEELITQRFEDLDFLKDVYGK